MKSRFVLVFVTILVARMPASATCLGDCDRDGNVTVDEILAGLSVALEIADLAICPAFDRDGDGIVQVDEVLGAVDYALNGCPKATPTASATPTRTPTATPTPLPDDPAKRVIALAAPRVCRPGGYSGGSIHGTTFHCDAPGHYGYVTLSGPHASPPVLDPNDPDVGSFAEGVLRIERSPHPYTADLGGTEQRWLWSRDCWSLSGFVSDDTSYRFPPQPHESIRAVVQAAEEVGLFDLCDPPDSERGY